MASESLTNTNISDTYVGVLHAKGEAIPASGLQDVYDGFGNKSALSIGRAGNGIDVDGTLGSNFKSAIAEAVYPVGSIIFSIDNTNPGVRFTSTTWTQVAEGKFIAGVGTGTDSNAATHTVTAGDTDTTGEYEHALTVGELPSHSHTLLGGGFNGSEGIEPGSRRTDDLGQSGTTGNNESHNNIPPTFGMYVWQRTA